MQLTSAIIALLSFTSIVTAFPHSPYSEAGFSDLLERDEFDFVERDGFDFGNLVPRAELLRVCDAFPF